MTPETLEQLNAIKTDHVIKKLVQDMEKSKTNKYTHIKRSKDENGIDYQVNEYVCPNAEVGFDIMFYATIDGKEYSKSICYGQEALTRQHDWSEIINDLI